MSRTRLLILPAVLVLGLGLAACGGGKSHSAASSSASSASASGSAAASAPAAASNATTPTVQTAKPSPAPPSPSNEVATPDASSIDPKAVETGDLSKDEYPEVSLDKSVRVDGDVVISLGKLQAQDFASGPAEVGGPGVLVPVTVTNNSGQDLALASVLSTTVNYGEGVAPSSSRLRIARASRWLLIWGRTTVLPHSGGPPADAGRRSRRVCLPTSFPSKGCRVAVL